MGFDVRSIWPWILHFRPSQHVDEASLIREVGLQQIGDEWGDEWGSMGGGAESYFTFRMP